MWSVMTVTGDGSLLRLTADDFLSRSSKTSLLNPPPPPMKLAEDSVEIESIIGVASWKDVLVPRLFADNNLGVE